MGCKGPARPAETIGQGGEKVYRSGTAKRSVLELPDGTRVLMNAGTELRIPAGFNRPVRELALNGEALFTLGGSGSDSPFVVHTRALVAAFEKDLAKSREGIFKVNGYSNSPGEEIDLLSGGLLVKKSYHSTTDNEPERLGPGEMIMINTDIDLMEKEKFDTAELKTWIDTR